MKRYFSVDGKFGEGVYELGVYKLKDIIEAHIKNKDIEVIVYEMKKDYGGEMWCSKERWFVEKWRGICGMECQYYLPCNGVSGRCRHLKNGFIPTGRKYKLLNGKLTLMEDKI